MRRSKHLVLFTLSAVVAFAGFAVAAPDGASDTRAARAGSAARLRVKVARDRIGVEVVSADPALGVLRLMDDVNDGEITVDGGTDGVSALKNMAGSGGAFRFLDASSQPLVSVLQNGRVGIGTTSPAAVLDIGGQVGSSGELVHIAGNVILENSAPNGNVIKFQNGQGDVSWDMQGTAAGFGISRSGIDYPFSISPNGNVGIGGAAADAFRLEVHGNARFDSSHFGINQWFGDTAAVVRMNAGDQRALTLQNASGITILTTDPSGLSIEPGFNAFKPGGGSWSVSSDLRLKKDVRPLTGALGTLLGLHGVRFEYKDPAAIRELAGERIGFVAQDVEKVLPDWVEEVGGYKRLTVRGFEALAVESIREIKAENDALKAANADLERRLDALETGLAARLEKLERAGEASSSR